jgi:5-formyltetrahydrofolate cyclo-ligase
VTWTEVRAWRRNQRAALLEARLGLSLDTRNRWSAALTERAMELLPALSEHVVGIYWPFKGEYDPRPLAQALDVRATPVALPVVVRKAAPLVFRTWRLGDRMTLGVWNMLVPAEGRPVIPGTLLVPLLGFDRHGYRLGYGGGYYDRTLAKAEGRPLLIGLGFEQALLPTIHPQPHDVPMDLIVTEQRTRCVSTRGMSVWTAARENAGTAMASRCQWSRG